MYGDRVDELTMLTYNRAARKMCLTIPIIQRLLGSKPPGHYPNMKLTLGEWVCHALTLTT